MNGSLMIKAKETAHILGKGYSNREGIFQQHAHTRRVLRISGIIYIY